MINLFEYQQRAKDQLRPALSLARVEQKGTLLVKPTGAGKTVTAADLAKSVADNGKRALFVADRIILAEQTLDAFLGFGINAAQCWGGEGKDLLDEQNLFRPPILVATAQTIESVGAIPDDIDLIIWDECHCNHQKFADLMLAHRALKLGLTATPTGAHLQKYFHNVVSPVTTYDLIDLGRLVNVTCYEVQEIDMEGIRPTGAGGDWSANQIEKEARKIKGAFVENWERVRKIEFGDRIPMSLLFGPSVAFCEDRAQEFIDAGYEYEVMSFHVPSKERKKILAAYDAGKVHGLCSVDVLTKGFDRPAVEVVQDARPTRSFGTHIQIYGRGMRCAPGKERMVLIDHSGNYRAFAEPREMFYREGPGDNCLETDEWKKAKRKKKDKVTMKKCKHCGFVIEQLKPGQHTCPKCGKELRTKGGALVELVPGQAVEVPGIGPEHDYTGTPEQTLREICVMARGKHPTDSERRKKWTLAQYRNLMGDWPDSNLVSSLNSDQELLREVPHPAIFKMVNSQIRKYMARKKIQERYGS